MDVNAVEQNVVDTRDAAGRVLKARKRAMEIKDRSMLLTDGDLDEWQLYKKAKELFEEIGEVEQEANNAAIEANKCWRDVSRAIGGRDSAFTRLAKKTAREAYEQSNAEHNTVARLAAKVRQNCKDACPQLS